ncbi:hypothetical protein VNO78_13956 [Psophocarpus tetragonolobus]|uniref:Uncharacterized protein n=1 Tax=Psophocarpus tetragonolobus TaxID=3891 RepID=A0AAN9SSN8_PSOTE
MRSAIRGARVVKETVELNHSNVRWYVFGDDFLPSTFQIRSQALVDLRGNTFGLLAAHPVTPVLSLHHPDKVDPIFPDMTTIKALQHLFEAADVDFQRLL